MKVIKIFLISLICTGLLSACGGGSDTTVAAAKGSAPDAAKGQRGGRGGGGSAPRKVTTAPAVEKAIQQVAIVTGTLAAEQEVILGMKVAGRLSDINVDLGSPVKKGEPVARLDTTDFDLRVRQ